VPAHPAGSASVACVGESHTAMTVGAAGTLLSAGGAGALGSGVDQLSRCLVVTLSRSGTDGSGEQDRQAGAPEASDRLRCR
jgi:hypothetical protein